MSENKCCCRDTAADIVLSVETDMPTIDISVQDCEAKMIPVTYHAAAEWELLSEYIPKMGEFCIYRGGLKIRNSKGKKYTVDGIKIGDGRTPVGKLKFTGSTLPAIQTLKVSEMIDILEDEPGDLDAMKEAEKEKHQGGGSRGILKDDEIETILNHDPTDDYPDAGDNQEDILTDDEILRILNGDQGD